MSRLEVIAGLDTPSIGVFWEVGTVVVGFDALSLGLGEGEDVIAVSFDPASVGVVVVSRAFFPKVSTPPSVGVVFRGRDSTARSEPLFSGTDVPGCGDTMMIDPLISGFETQSRAVINKRIAATEMLRRKTVANVLSMMLKGHKSESGEYNGKKQRV